MKKKLNITGFLNLLENPNDFLQLCYRMNRPYLVLMEVSINELSKPNMRVLSSLVNVRGYFTLLDIEIEDTLTGVIKNVQLPYVNGIEKLVDYQPDFKFYELFVYLYQFIDWEKLEKKFSNKSLTTIKECYENKLAEEHLIEMLALDSVNEELYHELQMEALIEEHLNAELNNEILLGIIEQQEFHNELMIEASVHEELNNEFLLSELCHTDFDGLEEFIEEDINPQF